MSARLPMFPLGTVLAPYGLLSVHVFEPRYRVLVFDCLRGEPEFGVVLIERGSEVGGEDQRFAVATVARIVEATELPDGRWFLLAIGTRRVDVVDWLADDPYPVAMVEPRAELPWPDAGEVDVVAAQGAVRRALALAAQLEGIDEEAESPVLELSDDQTAAAWQLLAAAPIASLDKQRLLAIDDHAERLCLLAVLAAEQERLLAYRLTGE